MQLNMFFIVIILLYKKILNFNNSDDDKQQNNKKINYTYFRRMKIIFNLCVNVTRSG